MRESRISQFSHLLRALSAGCPPHAGLAIGFDRLIAVMRGKESVKDVIAFPKSSKGEDMLVKSPRRIWRTEWDRYHLRKLDTRREAHLARRTAEENADEEDGEEDGENRSKWWKSWLERMREDPPFRNEGGKPVQ
jgi:aspartyl-tRNA synthetase